MSSPMGADGPDVVPMPVLAILEAASVVYEETPNGTRTIIARAWLVDPRGVCHLCPIGRCSAGARLCQVSYRGRIPEELAAFHVVAPAPRHGVDGLPVHRIGS